MTSLRERWAAGGETLGFWLSVPSFLTAEITARQPVDYVCVDTQHGVVDYQASVAMIQAIELSGGTPIVRVPWNEPGIIGKALDGGAWGIICPMINTPADAKALASYALYPPKGKRSNGPIRAGAYGAATPYQATANDEVLVIPMIETQEAIDNIDAILDVPGVSGIYVGPSDLGLSLGLKPMLDREEPQVLKIYEKLTTACKKRNLFAGIHNGTATYAARAFGMGFQLCTIANDSGLMALAARGAVNGFRKEVGAAADK